MAVPPEIPIVKFYTPDKRDQGLIEFHNTELAKYVPLDVGSVHPNTRDYPGFKLGKQSNLPNDEKWVVRIFVKDETGAEWFGWALKYLGEANANPIFIRTYREPRNTYVAKTKGTALKAVYKLTVTNAGTGYTPGAFPALTFSGGAGTGAAGHGVVNPSGTIAEFVLDDGGDNYTSSPTFTVAAPPSGTTATGTAFIQPATAVLTTEEAQEYPQDSEFYGLYLNIVRVYETLPGPYLSFTRYDENLGPIQGRRRAVVNTGQAAVITATSKKTYEAREGSSYVSWEIEEAWSNGTGVGAGNSVYPTLVKDFYDDERGAVQQTSQIVVATGSEVGSLAVSGSVVTRITYEPYADNPALLRKITSTWTLSGPLLNEKEYDQTWDVVIPSTRQIVKSADVNLATNRQQVKALNPVESEVVTFDPSALAAVFDTYLNYFSSTTNLQLPDVLTSLTGVVNKAEGSGTYSEAATGVGSGTTYFLSMSAQGTGQGSASIQLDLLVEIKQYWARNVPIVTYYLFLQSPVTAAAILAKLQTLSGLTITAWPKFIPEAHTVIAKGQKRSGEARAKVGFQQSSSSDGSSATDTGGIGHSYDMSTSVKSIRIPPTIHGSISISGTTSDSQAFTAYASASDPVNGTLDDDADGSAAGSLTPTSFSATSPSSVPTSGVKLLKSEPVLRRVGYVLIACDTVDMAGIA